MPQNSLREDYFGMSEELYCARPAGLKAPRRLKVRPTSGLLVLNDVNNLGLSLPHMGVSV